MGLRGTRQRFVPAHDARASSLWRLIRGGRDEAACGPRRIEIDEVRPGWIDRTPSGLVDDALQCSETLPVIDFDIHDGGFVAVDREGHFVGRAPERAPPPIQSRARQEVDDSCGHLGARAERLTKRRIGDGDVREMYK